MTIVKQIHEGYSVSLQSAAIAGHVGRAKTLAKIIER